MKRANINIMKMRFKYKIKMPNQHKKMATPIATVGLAFQRVSMCICILYSLCIYECNTAHIHGNIALPLDSVVEIETKATIIESCLYLKQHLKYWREKRIHIRKIDLTEGLIFPINLAINCDPTFSFLHLAKNLAKNSS